jgi:threonine dehydrogenase-like Zn-dependent dehydrogenase
MRAAIFGGPGRITVGERPDPGIQQPTDAIVRVSLACVCGSDLWYYRGLSPHDLGAIGHEFVGTVAEVGSEVRDLRLGDFVVTPFTFSDGTCVLCRAGWFSNCLHGGGYGNHGIDGGQGEAVRVPFADATLVKVPGSGHSDRTLRSILALSDVACTGHHAAARACLPSSPRNDSGLGGSLRSPATRLDRQLRGSSERPTSSRSVGTRQSRPCAS